MNNQVIEQTKQFLKKSFIKNPSFSFNDWRIMYNHGLMVLNFSLKLAQKIKCDKLLLSVGALLHDIGKIEIKDQVLQKKGQLSPEEYRHVQEHPLIGVKILEAFDFLRMGPS